jgi:hypothetical protein
VVVRQARLVRRVDRWREGGGAARFAEACVARGLGLVPSAAPERALLDDASEAARHGYVAVAAFAAALAVGKTRRGTDGPDQAYRLERAWQSAWIARELAL